MQPYRIYVRCYACCVKCGKIELHNTDTRVILKSLGRSNACGSECGLVVIHFLRVAVGSWVIGIGIAVPVINPLNFCDLAPGVICYGYPINKIEGNIQDTLPRGIVSCNAGIDGDVNRI